MTQPQESEMKANEQSAPREIQLIDLGTASVATQGNKPVGEEIGGNRSLGISEE